VSINKTYSENLQFEDKGALWPGNQVLESEGHIARVVNINGLEIDLNGIEASLVKQALIEECRVMVRENTRGEQELVAYIVASGPIPTDQLDGYLKDKLTDGGPSCTYVPVSCLPLNDVGQVDEKVLASLEVVDVDLIHACEQRLRYMPGVDKVAVVLREQPEPIPPLHLTDLILGWRVGAASKVDEPAGTPIAQEPIREERGSKVPSISHGGPLRVVTGAPSTLPDTLQRAAIESPEKGVVHLNHDGSELFQPYPALLEGAERILTGLRKLGLKPQDKVIFQFDRTHDFIPALWGCILGGIVPVPIGIAPSYKDLNSTVHKIHNAWQMLDEPIVLTSEALAPKVKGLSNLLELENFRVETTDHMQQRERDRNWHECQPEDLTLMMLTSGSTGAPKGVMLNHRNLVCRSVGSQQLNDFTRDEVTFNWMPLDHVAGILYFHLRDVFLGCQQVHSPIELILQDPLKWLDFIERFRATATFAPNFAYGLVNDQAKEIARRSWDLSSLRFVLNGAEAIVAKTARKFMELLIPHGLPPTAMYPVWGMSELSSGVTYSNKFSLETTRDDDPFVDVGAPIPGFSMRIVDDEDRVVEEGTVGRLQARGSTVTSGYFKRPDLNEEEFTNDGWFKTGDLAFLKDGCLTITGREKDVIIINSVNYYSHEIEGVVEEIEGVETSYTAACAVRDPGIDTDKLVIFFHPSSSDGDQLLDLLKEIRTQVINTIGVNPEYLLPVRKQDIPKTEIGKIQRTQLSKRFMEGEFDAALKRVDLLSGGANTIPNWLFSRIWRRKDAAIANTQSDEGSWIVFCDELGLGEALCTKLKTSNKPFVKVEVGDAFISHSKEAYQIDPLNPDHYQLLLETVAAEQTQIERIVHLWTYDEYDPEISSLETLERSQDKGVCSLLFLVQELNRIRNNENSVQLLVVSSYAQPVLFEDNIAAEKSPALGLIKTVPQEMPWINCRHIDLALEEPEVNADHLLKESRTTSNDREIAYRNGARWVSRLERFEPGTQQLQELPFKQGGMYVLSGGLGGIGVEIARYLLTNYKARLLLVGRAALPDLGTSSTNLEGESSISERIKTLKSMKELGGEVRYEAVDICDFDKLKSVVEATESNWQCELAGVINLAGVFRQRLLTEESHSSFSEILSPKLLGTWALDQLVKDRLNILFISFSSVNGFFGGFSVGAYAAASAFLDNFVHYQQRRNSMRSHCFSWSMWDDIGMSRDYPMKDLTRSRGYYTISTKQGLNSFIAALQLNQTQLLIGIDSTNQYIRRYVDGDSHKLNSLIAYFTTPKTEVPLIELQEKELKDRFGTLCSCHFQQIQQMPLNADGEIDRPSLIASGHRAARTLTDQAAPGTDLEREVLSIWQETLNKEGFGIRDNFFDLGGNSLLMAQVYGRVLEKTKQDISMTDMFQHPTIYSLAKYLGQDGACQMIDEFEESQIRGVVRREKMKRRRKGVKSN